MTAPTPLSAKLAHEILSSETEQEKILGHDEQHSQIPEKPKFKFEPKEHLTRNLRDHEGLQKLASTLKQNREQNHARSSK